MGHEAKERLLLPSTVNALQYVSSKPAMIRPSEIKDEAVRARIEAADREGRGSMVCVGPKLARELDAVFRAWVAENARRAGEEEAARAILESEASYEPPEELEAIAYGATGYPYAPGQLEVAPADEAAPAAPAAMRDELPELPELPDESAPGELSPWDPKHPSFDAVAWWAHLQDACARLRRMGQRPPRHECHAHGCKTLVPPRLLMCSRHWIMVPARLRNAVWNAYVEGQEVRKDPSSEYLDAATAAIDAVRESEEHEQEEADDVSGVQEGAAVSVRGNEARMSGREKRVGVPGKSPVGVQGRRARP